MAHFIRLKFHSRFRPTLTKTNHYFSIKNSSWLECQILFNNVVTIFMANLIEHSFEVLKDLKMWDAMPIYWSCIF